MLRRVGDAMAIKVLLRALTVVLVLCLGAVGVLLYRAVEPGRSDLPPSTAVAGAAPAAEALGEFTPLETPRPAPDVGFATRSGEPVRLSSFRHRMVLVNLWATWCGPCVHEMPSLDRLQAALGGDLTILAISEDRGGAATVNQFLTKHGIKNLAAYLDPQGNVAHAFGVDGLPTSFLIGRDGRILGWLKGAADWDSPAMQALLRHYIAAPAHLEKASLAR
jgi:thiol-disulfide isomerase/thioredoxin